MSTESRKESKLYLRSKEATAGTEDAYDFFETSSAIMTKPPSTSLKESNLGKLGAGEFGTKQETQAIYTPFTVKVSRLSEFLYFMSFFQGKEDSMRIVDAGNKVFSHLLDHLAITSRTLPTFTAFYSDGSTIHAMKHCIISDFSFTLAAGGNGVIDATFNGFCNMHKDNSGSLAKDTVATGWSSGEYTTIVAAESLINYKGCVMFMGSATEAVPLVHANVAYGSSNLTGSEIITPFVNSLTVTGNNGITAEDSLRASGGGVLNNQERKDFAYTLEMQVRKDDTLPATTYDAMFLADTQRAIEIGWLGKTIKDAHRYGLDIVFPVVQLSDVKEDDESPINQTLSYTVFANTSAQAFQVFGQTKVGIRYNASHGTDSSSSQSASVSSSSLGLSSSSST